MISGIHLILRSKDTYRHAGDAPGMSPDEDTQNQTSTIRTPIFDKVTSLLQLVEHLLLKDNAPPIQPSSMFPTTDDFDVHIDASQPLHKRHDPPRANVGEKDLPNPAQGGHGGRRK